MNVSTDHSQLDPTQTQRRASDPKVSVWVSANAGTGKTKVLTERVLSLLVTGTQPHHILCLTFTKAAAAEMSNRIADHLGKWSIIDDQSLEQELSDLLSQSPSPAELIRARQLFAKVLDSPGGLQILTIHAFCQSLLRRFPLEADLAAHFEVMDDRLALELLQKAQDQVMFEAKNGRIAELNLSLKVITSLIHESHFPDLISKINRERGRLRRILDEHGGVRPLVAHLGDLMGLAPTDTPELLKAKASAQDSFDALGLRIALEALLAGSKEDLTKAALIQPFLEAPETERAHFFDSYCAAFINKSDGHIKKRLITQTALKKSPGAEDVLKVEAERVFDVLTKCKASITLNATKALLRLGKSLLDNYETEKNARALLDYDDLILKTRDLLNENRVPWVLYKLDGGIHHILVDEAQDTNPDQWQVIEALSREFYVGDGPDSHPSPRTVFAVGDVKQSIYSFQGADPASFDQMRQQYSHQVPLSGQIWREVPMTVSFRSTRAVLESVDQVFSPDLIRQGVSLEEMIHHEAFRLNDGGLVELWPPVLPKASDPGPAWKPQIEAIQSDSPRARLAELIATRIQEMIQNKEILQSKGRPINAGDIMVLVQRRSGFIEELVRNLKVLGVEVAGVDRMILTDQICVMDLLALGRFLVQPEDDLSLACVLKSPLLGLSEDQLFHIAYKRKGRLWQSLIAQSHTDLHVKTAYDQLRDLLRRTDVLRPFDLFTYVLSAQKGRHKFLSRLGVESLDPLNEFMDMCLAYEKSHTPSLEGFLDWMERGETEIKRDLETDSQNAVRIMTVHGAKGLQAPIVFLPDTFRIPKKGENLYWPQDPESGKNLFIWCPNAAYLEPLSEKEKAVQKQRREEEYRRLLYVAMTRAEDRLYVCGWEGKNKPSEGNWYDVIKAGLMTLGETQSSDFLKRQDQTASDEILRHECEQKTDPTLKPDKDIRQLRVETLPDWAKSMPDQEPTPPRPLVPSRPDELDPPARSPLGEDHGHRYHRGNLIHSLLQTLPDLEEAQRTESARTFLSNPAHGLTPAQQSEILGETLGVLSHPEFSEVFAPGSKAEVPIVGELNGKVLSGQIDRLVIQEKTILIVDYKTNRPPPRTIKKIPPLYLRQMQIYHQALSKIYPDHEVRCLLLWTDAPRLMEVPRAMLNSL